MPTMTRAYWIATMVYALLAALVMMFGDTEAFTRDAADGASWTEPGRGLALHGDFVKPVDPEASLNYRPPAYPLLLAGAMLLDMDGFAPVVVGAQLILLYLTAVVTARLATHVAPGFGALAFCLILFNPNAFGTAFFTQSETLNAFFVVLVAAGLLHFARRGSLLSGAGTGAAVAAVCLTRPEGMFLIILAPLCLVLLGGLGKARSGWAQGVKAGGMALVVSLVVTAPWMGYNAALGDGYRLTASGSTAYFVWGGAAQLEMEASGVDESTAEQRSAAARNAFIKAQGGRWNTLSNAERDALLVRAGLERIFSYDFGTIAANVTKATAQFLLSGGSGRLFALIGDPNSSPFSVMVRDGMSSHAAAVWRAMTEGHGGLLLIWAAALGYVMVARLLGLVGLWWLIRRGEYDVLLIVVAGIAFYALVFPFYGISRFRVAVECLLVLLAVGGIAGLRDWWRALRPPR
jgi:hypothetical protein